MSWYKMIKQFYDWDLYTEEQVYRFVTRGQITQEEAEQIINSPREFSVGE